MLIQEASLCLRFYTRDGWNRSKVSELMKEPNIHKVLPRYFDERDVLIENLPERWTLESDLEYEDCEYYAVYGASNSFDQNKLEQHKINPFWT